MSLDTHIWNAICKVGHCGLLLGKARVSNDGCLRQDSFGLLPAPVLCDILSQDTFNAPELAIFEAVQRWSKDRCAYPTITS
jgi:hypothetical protein